MVAYVDYLDTTVDPRTGLISDSALGDWLGPQNNLIGSGGLRAAEGIFQQNFRQRGWQDADAIDQGATTIWERLNGYTVEDGFGGNNSMNSFNHYSFGAVGQWMMAYSLGIQRDEPGFRKFILQPVPDPTGTMTWAEGHYDSMYGRIASGWKITDKLLTYRATVPANAIATLHLPARDAAGVKESGRDPARSQGVRFIKHENGKAVYELASGTYEFAVAR